MMQHDTKANGTPGPRWWPAISILVLFVVGLIAIWGRDLNHRQMQVMLTSALFFVVMFLLAAWLFLASRLPGKTRLKAAGGLVVLLLAGAGLFEFRGLSGDLVPMVDWRWASRGVVTSGGEAGSGRLTSASDFPQYLGADRDGIVSGVTLARDWDAAPPELVWRRPIGDGWSGFAVAGDFAVTHEQRDTLEAVVAYDLTTGNELWAYTVAARHDDPLGGPGPRATPAIVDGRVYAQGATGLLTCLDQATGDVLWQRDIVTDHSAKIPEYGVTASPLILDDQVIALAGGPAGHSLVAYDRLSGEPLWSNGSDPAAYSSPMLATLGGELQILVFTGKHLNGHRTDGGEVLWQYPWPSGTERTSQPLVLSGDRVFLSSGYGTGGKMFQIRPEGSGWTAQLVWESPRLKAKLTNVVQYQGHIYGLDDGVLVCLDPETGERCWKRGRYGHGQILLVGSLLLVQSERGEVFLVEAQPEEHVELGSFQAIEGKSWNTMALAGDLLLVRNADEAACYRLPTTG